jgi:hypothetical protein
MKKERKAQVTIFIVLAVIILFVVGGIFFVMSKNKQARLDNEFFSQASIKPDVDNIKSAIINCMEETSESALELIGIQGGYFREPEKYSDVGEVFIPYYYYEGQLLMPSKEKIESELAAYVDYNLNSCLNELNFENYELDYKTPKTLSKIKSEDEVVFTTELSVNINREGRRTVISLQDFPVEQKSALFNILDVANYYTDSHKKDPVVYCISCLGEMAAEKNLYVDVIDFSEQEELIVISENYTSSEPYSFEFLNKYTRNEESPVLSEGEAVPLKPIAE